MNPPKTTKLRVGALTALVVGSMVGGGIFSIPQNTAASAGVGATAIAWLITGVGMLALAFVMGDKPSAWGCGGAFDAARAAQETGGR